ncbi:sigma-54-dependent Fis family transcriptional regulator [Bacillus solimangrovi]|uniref:Sigma-54-dependent Fis family transcriptional regulator n=1 Tax=Bacillus solimangrovi TaxID=1305675 RepID=A0A1E5LCM2_9BACI|nr:sigma-54-dependent Fis family transcriptional regulator [Bacillus solimangrovi]OEH91825.1 hypothetical protein BFG57_03550 [Bacillus solimangrovi]
MNVRQFTTTNYINLSPHATIRSVLKTFIDHKQDIGCVTKKKKLLGIVTKYSIYRALLNNCSLDFEIEQIMKKDVITLRVTDNLYKAKDILTETNVSNAVVLEENNDVYGVMTKTDVIRSFNTGSKNVESRLRTLIENLQDAVISVDEQFHITAYNHAAFELFELNTEKFINKHIANIYPSLYQGLNHSITTGEIIELQEISIGSFTLIASFIPLKEFDIISGAMVVLRDITSFEKISSELESTKQLEQLLDSALELAYDGVVIVDNEGTITRANQGFAQLFDYKQPEKIFGQSLELIAPEISQQHDGEIEGKLLQINNQPCIYTQRPIHRDDNKLGMIIKIIFKQLDVWKDLFHHMEQLENEITFVQGEIRRLTNNNQPLFKTLTVSPQMEHIKEEAYIASKSSLSILITGESGTGKGVLAEDIHNASERNGAFIKVNCAAIPHELLESEFFGYVDGAFTGAKRGGKPGKFELANNGTLFLDEIGDMPMALQAKLLNVLQEGEFERVGDTKTSKVDVRVLAATNKNLKKLVAEKTFREDLYYRLHVIHIHLPPLSKRKDDIPILCHHFIKKINERTNKNIIGLTPNTLKILNKLNWEGNIRQLENLMERAIHYCNSTWIEPQHLPLDVINNTLNFENDNKLSIQPSTDNEETANILNRKKLLDSTDKNTIIDALTKSQGNRTKAAKLLGISRATLYKKINKYKITETSNFTTS